ncbi:16S rRNA (cytosine1402-N4)-methyltransferase [Sporobacter termitidis DSM 10068]|uniref:Ribosomal RNA small subunit methyltransferase H n=1 Tax=Sporobacter termitidis DSM 10068 TaxID=1123282 RepID=A0A1M5WZL7_9FIRM|nr:16S rRNA (cytosine(1402)-N(4))-methyltransferase RsmH [Sporobacter termitidis]SHH92812.1 16S rRNA (cytosine1402-N4)-methyltransferase [Sporobacter termitidis DSM 10068]
MEHIPVLLHECVDGLRLKPDGIYVDGTLGRAGHSAEIAKRLKGGRLIGIDRDEAAIGAAYRTLEAYKDRVTLVRGNFRDVGAILDGLGIQKVDGMLFDLGVSSPQLDDAGRGFSYMSDAPLDMRMDQGDALTADAVVNGWPQDELRRILYEYGEERYAPKIAAAIVRRRGDKKIETTAELVDVIKAAMPAKALREKQHPAKRSFQAIRIAVNDELGAVGEMLSAAPDRLNKGGRLCVISFQSLEDKLVKAAVHKREKGCTCPPDFPVCVCGFSPTLKTITKKPITPGPDELSQNPRSRSAKLRIAERV